MKRFYSILYIVLFNLSLASYRPVGMDRPFSYPVYGRMPDKTDQIHDNRIIPAFYFQISRIFYCTVLNQYPVYPFCRESNRGLTYLQKFCMVDFPRNYEREDENPFPGCQFRISLVQPHKKYAMFLLTESQWRNHF